MNNKLEVIKIITPTPCYCCNEGLYGKARATKGCTACDGTKEYKETHYIHIINGIAIDGDLVK